jgi:hypothetical protein
MKHKYMSCGGISYTRKKPGDSPLWSDMLQVKQIYLKGRRMKVGNGRDTSFWCDAWCDQIPLKDRFPEIFDICIEQNVIVAAAATMNWNFSFRRWMTPDIAWQIHGLNQIMSQTVLTDMQDKPHWKWTKSGKFSVKSVYNHLCSNGIDRTFKHLWKSRIPLKIKIWLWMIWHNAIATKDNLLRRNWQGSATCQFCSNPETISHLFFSCPAAKFVWSAVGKLVGANSRPGSFTQFFWWLPQFIPASRNTQIAGLAAICWAIWKLRNRSCFDHKMIKDPVELISYSTVFMKYWAGLHGEKDAEDLRLGADGLLKLATASTAAGRARNMPGQVQMPLQIREASDAVAEEDDMEVDEHVDIA